MTPEFVLQAGAVVVPLAVFQGALTLYVARKIAKLEQKVDDQNGRVGRLEVGKLSKAVFEEAKKGIDQRFEDFCFWLCWSPLLRAPNLPMHQLTRSLRPNQIVPSRTAWRAIRYNGRRTA